MLSCLRNIVFIPSPLLVSAPTIVEVKALLQDQLSEHNTPLTLSGTVEAKLHLCRSSSLMSAHCKSSTWTDIVPENITSVMRWWHAGGHQVPHSLKRTFQFDTLANKDIFWDLQKKWYHGHQNIVPKSKKKKKQMLQEGTWTIKLSRVNQQGLTLT